MKGGQRSLLSIFAIFLSLQILASSVQVIKAQDSGELEDLSKYDVAGGAGETASE